MKQVIRFLTYLYERIMDGDVFGLAAQLAYFFLLSLFPLLILVMTLIGYLPLDEQSILDALSSVIPSESMAFIEANIRMLLNQQNTGLLSIGILGTLWSASNGVNAIIRALNRAYQVEETRPFLVSRFVAIILMFAMIAVIVVALLLPVLGRMIGVYIFSFFGLSDDFIQFWNTFRWVISAIVFFIVFLALYRLAPSRNIHLKNVVPGALFTTLSWQLTSLAFSYYVETIGDYSATYGSLGAVIVLMIWFYMSGIIIIIGGTINAVTEEWFEMKEED
ncbi:membrane protein [Cerasibacillus quisquiliarum]|uniref:Putative ribonuclease-like protein YfkH n=1 Tax=Cerasibacillus quisquiliarum TaxID=227865 RepID=A0A511V0V0_9BACI|nr:YihY/virulence factor BrkB family protein [Cerasibacillus quisquiliarum]MBB5146645.1 membrane protein [Cerasibacillus quisquiliarum]GEN31343.1 putative ribonuclease-like protein YfkH [Cerasibacillus quisquiliarum]